MNEKQREEAFKKDIAAAEKTKRELANLTFEDWKNGIISQQRFNVIREGLEDQLLHQKLLLYIQYGKDTSAIEDQIADNTIKRFDEIQTRLANYKQDFQNKYGQEEQADASEDAEITALYEKIKQHEQRMASDAEAIKQELRSNSIRETANMELTALEQLHQAGLLSEQQYEAKKLQIKLSATEKYIQKTNALTQIGANFVSAMQDAEYAKIEATKQKELALAGDDADKRQEIEEKAEAEKLKIQQKYADIDMGVKIAQTIAAGALAAVQAFAQLGPIGGAIAAAVIAATTAFQIASIIQQRNAIKNAASGGSSSGSTPTQQRVVLPGKEDGGYVETERAQDSKRFRAKKRKQAGFVDEPMVLTGEAGAEFVANADAVNNPTVKPVLDIIDMAQRSGSISSINLPAIVRVMGKEAGGYLSAGSGSGVTTGSPPAGAAVITGVDGETMAVMKEVRALLQSLKDNGVKAPIVLSELERQQALMKKSTILGSRK